MLSPGNATNRSTESNAFPWPLALLAAALILWRLVDFMLDPLTINWDASMYLLAGSLLLDGATPYIDVVELNPPLAWYLHAIPAGLGRLLGISVPLTFNLLIVAAAATSSLLTYRLLKLAQPGNEHYMPAIMALVPLICLHWFAKVGYFGQREFLLILALLPFLALRALRHNAVDVPPVLAITLGLLISATAYMKAEYFGLLLVCTELAMAIRHKNMRPWLAPEIIVVAVFGAAYIGHFFLLPDAAWQAFLFRYIPLIVQNYGVFGADAAQLNSALISKLLPPLALTVIAGVYALRRPASVTRDLALLAIVIGVVGVLSFWLQGKGWPYHRIPTLFSAIFALAVALSSSPLITPLLSRTGLSAGQLKMASLIVAILAVAIISITPKGYNSKKSYMAGVFESHGGPGDAILVMSGGVLPGHPAMLQAQRKPGSRYVFMFPIPLMYNNGAPDSASSYGYTLPADLQAEEQLFLDEISQDINARKPVAIFVESAATCLACPPGFSMLSYLAADPELQQIINADYTRTEDSQPYAVFTRNPEGL